MQPLSTEDRRVVAAKLAMQYGFRCVELHKLSKRPKGKEWQRRGTQDPMDVVDFAPDCNVGLLCGEDFIGLDIDAKDGAPGLASMEKLELPDTYTVKTPNGGLHKVYRVPKGVAFTNSPAGLEAIAPGIDVRGRGGQLVMPGGKVERRAEFGGGIGVYELIDPREPVELPQNIVALLRRARDRSADAGRWLVEPNTPWAIERGDKYMREEVEKDIPKGARDQTAHKVAARLADFGLDYDEILDRLEKWNAEFSEPLEQWEIEKCARNGLSKRDNPIGCAHPDGIAKLKAEVFDPITPAPTPGAAELLEFTRDVDLNEVIKSQSNYLIKGLLYRGDQGMCHGPSTAGKTFFLLDMCWHLALGKEWHGCKVRKAPILYVSLEGVDGFKKRMKAIEREMGDPGDFFARLRPRVSLVRAENPGAEGLNQIIAASRVLSEKAGDQTGLIVIDTLSRAMAGDDENLQSDMMHFIEQRVGVICAQTGAAVMLLHHPGKNNKTERGSSALVPSLDLVLRIERDGEQRTVFKQKVKDGEEGPLFGFKLGVRNLAVDAEGDPVTSCVVEATELISEVQRKEEKLRGIAEWARPLIERAIDEKLPLSGVRCNNQFYVATWLLRQLVPGADVTKEEIETAYLRHLYGVAFVHVSEPSRNKDREPVSRIVRKPKAEETER